MRLTVLICAALAGCAAPGYWTRAGGNEQEFHADKAQCMSQAYSTVPRNPVAIGGSPGVSTTSCSGYGNTATCYTNPGVAMQPVILDANDNARMDVFRSCMMGKGWQWRTN